MKSSRKFSLKDFFVVLLCISGILGSLHFFYTALNLSLKNSNAEKIATITFKYRTAQRRFENRLVWEWLQNNADIYNGDHIRTAGLSEAVLHFTDNTIITLEENTLIQAKVNEEENLLPQFLKRKKEEPQKTQIKVSSGSLKIDTKKSSDNNISIVAGNHKIDASEKTQAILTVKENAVEIQTITGEVKVQNTTEEKEEVVVVEGNKISINEKNEVLVSEVSVYEPLNNSYYIFSDEDFAVVDFVYSIKKSDNSVSDAMLEISEKEDFSELYTYFNLEEDSEKYIQHLPEGKWNWRIHQKNNIGKTSVATSGSFNVYKVLAPEIFSPSQNSEFLTEVIDEKENAIAKVMLSWKNDRKAIKYYVNAECEQTGKRFSFYSEVSTCMTEIPFEQSVGEVSEKQKWTWTVTPVFPDFWKGEIPSSEKYVFYVLKQNTVKPETERLIEEIVTESEEIITENSVNEEKFSDETSVEETAAQDIQKIVEEEKPLVQVKEEPKKQEIKKEPVKTEPVKAKEVHFEEEAEISSIAQTNQKSEVPEFKISEEVQNQAVLLTTDFSDSSLWKVRTDKASGGASTGNCSPAVVEYEGKIYQAIKFESSINTSSVGKYNSTLFMNNLNLPESLYEASGVSLKLIGDGNTYTFRIGVGNIEYGCKLKTKKDQILQFKIPYTKFRQQTGNVLVELDPYDITGLTIAPSNPKPGKYTLTIFDMTAE